MFKLLFSPACIFTLCMILISDKKRAGIKQVEYLRAERLLNKIGNLRVVALLDNWPCFKEVVLEFKDKLSATGKVLTKEVTQALVLIMVLLLCLLSAIISTSIIGFLFGIIISFFIISALSASIAKGKQKELVTQIPEAYRSLASNLGSGRTLPQSIEYVGSHSKGVVSKSFKNASLDILCGASVTEGLQRIETEINDKNISFLTCVLAVSTQTGSAMEGLLNKCASMIESKSEIEHMMLVKTSQVRMSAKVVMILPVLLVCALALISPDFRSGMTSGVGAVCLLIAASMDICARYIMKKIMRSISV